MNKYLRKFIIEYIPLQFFYQYKLLIYKNLSKKNIEERKKIISKKYTEKTKSNINWEYPEKYTEKINYIKILPASDIKKELTDKVLVRNWIISKIGEEYLIPLYGVLNSFSEINFKELPEKFVIKCNHDSGSVFICDNKSKLNMKYLKNKYNFLIKRDYSNVHFEEQYRGIKSKIIIEKYMGNDIKDYKFLCFNGKPYYCWVDFNRYTNHKRNIYDLNWNLQPFNQYNYGNYFNSDGSNIEKPEKFDEMIHIVEILCRDFDHVRVDLYLIENQIYFGEMTFTNGSGLEPIVPEEWDYKLGKLWKIK